MDLPLCRSSEVVYFSGAPLPIEGPTSTEELDLRVPRVPQGQVSSDAVFLFCWQKPADSEISNAFMFACSQAVYAANNFCVCSLKTGRTGKASCTEGSQLPVDRWHHLLRDPVVPVQ